MAPAPSASAPPITRLAHPFAFGAFCRHIGAPVDRHLRSQGLPLYSDSPDGFVPVKKAWGFFDAMAQAEDPMLGWYTGKFVGDRYLNHNLLQKLETAPTLYQALKKLIQMVSSEASHLQLGIIERPDDILFYTHYPTFEDWPGYTSSQAYQLEIYLDLMRQFLGRHWVPEEIGIEYPTVPQVAREHFHDCRILTNQRLGYIAVPRACLHMPSRRSAQQQEGDSLLLTKAFNYADTLRFLLKTYLADGYPSASKAASLMDTSVRTMARRLSKCGVSYQAVVDEVRFDAARELLRNTDQSIGSISRSVGFDDPANFTRMFRRIAGLTPRQLRYQTNSATHVGGNPDTH